MRVQEPSAVDEESAHRMLPISFWAVAAASASPFILLLVAFLAVPDIFGVRIAHAPDAGVFLGFLAFGVGFVGNLVSVPFAMVALAKDGRLRDSELAIWILASGKFYLYVFGVPVLLLILSLLLA